MTPRDKATKSISSFTILEHIKPERDLHQHDMRVGIKKSNQILKAVENQPPKYAYRWFIKSQPDLPQAIIEVISQEWLRLFDPHQQKTRFIKNSGGTLDVASKEMLGLLPLSSLSTVAAKKMLMKGTLRGLGSQCVYALWLNETDFKPENLYLRFIPALNHYVIGKVDSEWCLTKLQKVDQFKDKNFMISEADLRILPAISAYYSYNWLDVLSEGKRIPNTKYSLIDPEISRHPIIRDEINAALLQISVLPRELIHQFVKCYTDSSQWQGKIIHELIERQTQLKQAALQNESFKQYLHTPAAAKTIEHFIRCIVHFKPYQKRQLIHDAEKLTTDINSQFAQLRQPQKTVMRSSTPKRLSTFYRPRAVLPPRPPVTTRIPEVRVVTEDRAVRRPVAEMHILRPDLLKAYEETLPPAVLRR